MTQKELWNQIALIHDSYTFIFHESKLLDLAMTLTDEFSEDNFDKIGLLVDCFRARLDLHLDDLRGTLNSLEKHLDSTKEEQDSD